MNLKPIFLSLLATAALAAPPEGPPSRLPVAVFDFQVSTGISGQLGADFAGIVATDLSVLAPAISVPETTLAAVGPQPRFDAAESIGPDAAARIGRTLDATAFVNGRMLFEGRKVTVVAKVTDTATGRVYGEMVQGEGSLRSLAAQLSAKIAALAIQIRGLPAVSWPPATLAAMPGAAETVDGGSEPGKGDITMEPGLHEVLLSWYRNGASTRATFTIAAEPGARYQVAFKDQGGQKVQLWLEKGSSVPATTPVERSWVAGADFPLTHTATYVMPGPRAGVAAVADDEAIYIIGGERFPEGHLPLGEILRFDLRSHAFTVLTESVFPREYAGAVLAGGKIYIMGGASVNARLHTMQIYDLAAHRLVSGPSMPNARRSFGAAVVANRIYVIGGSKVPPNSTDEVDYFDLGMQKWEQGPPMPNGLTGHAVVVGDHIIFPGGFKGDQKFVGDPDLRQGETTVQTLDVSRGRWTFLPQLPEPMSGTAMGVLDGRLYLLGAFFGDDRALAYDLATGRSFEFKIGQAGVRNAVAVTAGGAMYMIGGLIEGLGPSSRIDVFSENPNWAKSVPSSLPAAR